MKKELWEMNFSDIVNEIGDGELEHLDGSPVTKDQKEYYILLALAREIEGIKRIISDNNNKV